MYSNKSCMYVKYFFGKPNLLRALIANCKNWIKQMGILDIEKHIYEILKLILIEK